MIVAQQTVVLGPRVTAFSGVCTRCLDEGRIEPWPTFQGLLRLHDDHSWVDCINGHQIRVAREGRDVRAELTSPLW